MRPRLMIWLLSVILVAPVCSATTWYVRPDGGNRSECTGSANRPYTGHGKQACAFSQVRYLYTDGSQGNRKWIISGGDTVVIAKGAYRVGYLGPNSKDSDGSCPGDPYGCGIPPIPSGTPARHTRFLGEEYQSCKNKSQIFGGYATSAVLSLAGSRYVDVQCLEITDHAQCTRIASSSETCRTSYPLSDFAASGIVTDAMTSNILLQDLDIHGLTSRGIIGSIGGPVAAVRVRIAFNTGAGWDFDDHRPPGVSGAVNASQLTVEGNGCVEEYPIHHQFPARECFDQDHGGYGDGIGTADMRLDFKCDHCVFRYNTQDGLDLLHASGGTVIIENSVSIGNMGQQWKVGPAQRLWFANNLTENNCRRMSAPIGDSPASYNKSLALFCRAAGDGVSLALASGGEYSFVFNTYIGYGDTSFDFSCSRGGCSNAKIDFQNNIVVGYTTPDSSHAPGAFYFGDVDQRGIWRVRGNNIFFNSQKCPANFQNEKCSDPGFLRLPTWHGEATFEQIDPHLQWNSPARNAASAIPGVATDKDGTPRPATPSIGAFE